MNLPANALRAAAVGSTLPGMTKTVVALPGEGIANPTATILSAVLMLDHLGLGAESTRLDAALARVYRDGKTLTSDQGGSATTTRMAAEVLAAYRNQP